MNKEQHIYFKFFGSIKLIIYTLFTPHKMSQKTSYLVLVEIVNYLRLNMCHCVVYNMGTRESLLKYNVCSGTL